MGFRTLVVHESVWEDLKEMKERKKPKFRSVSALIGWLMVKSGEKKHGERKKISFNRIKFD